MMVVGQTMRAVVGQMMPVAVRKLIGMAATMVMLIVDANRDGKVNASDGIIEVGGGANTGV